MIVRVGTRASPLATTQTGHVVDRWRSAFPEHQFYVVTITTTGDLRQSVLPDAASDKGLFVKEIEEALADRRIDVAIHSLKDLPTDQPPGLKIGAVTVREDVRDALISRHGLPFDRLPAGSRVGTSSPRRKFQLAALRPDLTFLDMKGNVDTRINKTLRGDVEAVVLAAAGLKRLNHPHPVTQYFPADQIVPAPGQGALAVEIRSEPGPVADLVTSANDDASWTAVSLERACLRAVGGGCRMPIGVWARPDAAGWTLHGAMATEDGSKTAGATLHADRDSGDEPGLRLAQQLLKELGG